MADPVVTDLAQVDLRAPEPSALPFDVPDANTVTSWGDRYVLWLGPDEWLIVGPAGTEGAIVAELERTFRNGFRSIVDVSANRVAFDLTDGLERLSSGCPIDLDPARWRPGMCAQTLFGGAQVILHQLDERTTRVSVRPSFATHVVARLAAVVVS